MAYKLLSCFFIGFCILAGSATAKAAGTGQVTDTLPAATKRPEESGAKKTDEIIKEVPKSRRQEKPLAITPVIIKPVLVKPKVIVKPIIKIH